MHKFSITHNMLPWGMGEAESKMGGHMFICLVQKKKQTNLKGNFIVRAVRKRSIRPKQHRVPNIREPHELMCISHNLRDLLFRGLCIEQGIHPPQNFFFFFSFIFFFFFFGLMDEKKKGERERERTRAGKKSKSPLHTSQPPSRPAPLSPSIQINGFPHLRALNC